MGIQIRHSETEAMPRPDVRYRCPVCRLELVLDRATKNLTVAPLDSSPDKPPKAT